MYIMAVLKIKIEYKTQGFGYNTQQLIVKYRTMIIKINKTYKQY